MQKYKIIIAYDGTDFHGWQIQPKAITVVSCLKESFFRVFNKTINLWGASRTDAGVHALGQVAQFYTDLPISSEQILEAWNNGLPQSVVIQSISRASLLFHPCSNVKQKTYYYHLFFSRPLPCFVRYGWFYPYIERINIQKFERCLQLYIGEHDFASFCKIEDKKKSTVRTIDEISIQKFHQWSVFRIIIKGKSFLRFQIRRMIGYALNVACRNDLSVNYLKEVLESKDSKQPLLKANGSGLCLKEIFYHDSPDK
jgi:tRNA pseudouridine38-40 synthase